ncbi:hypothetical protein MMC24_001315 [Lignoscripta atroalba]|nr:hypothetical protein [Lignoscripta atroalba]
MVINTPGEGEWLSSPKFHEVDVGSEPRSPMDNVTPMHPVPTMQAAFEESIMETMTEVEEPEVDSRNSRADSISRRKMLLEQDKYERTVAGRWKQKPGEKFHPLWKQVAQISFGMHLLHRGLAKSDDEVIKILQTHVDEVDGFLERTTEDFDLAQGDINERIRYLRLPLEHGQVFDTMLNDRSFRIAIVEGNEKIEHIVDRTAAAMKDALKDVQKGLDATRELAKYLTRLDKTWEDRSEEHRSVYLAMIGNTEGWSRAFVALQQKGNKLGISLVQLGGIVAEMQRRAGIASRKNLVAVRSIEGKYFVEPRKPATSPQNSITPPRSPHKPLPRAPGTVSEAIQVTLPQKQGNQGNRQTSRRQPSKEAVLGKSVLAAKLIKTPPKLVSSPQPAMQEKYPARVASISARTRSLTRKISFFKDREDQEAPNNNLSMQDPTLKLLDLSKNGGTGASTDASPSERTERPLSRSAIMNHPKYPIALADSQNNDSEDISLSPHYPRSPHSRHLSDQSSSERMAVFTARREAAEGAVNTSYPIVKDVRFGNNVLNSARPTLRDLPLRHYRSQESLPTGAQLASRPAKDAQPPRRSISLRTSPTTFISPATRSSVYSQPSQPGLSSVHTPATQLAGRSPTYSPPGQLNSQLSDYSPITTTLSPAPAQSSATPSPLQIIPKQDAAPASLTPELRQYPHLGKSLIPSTPPKPPTSPSTTRRQPPPPISTATSTVIVPQRVKPTSPEPFPSRPLHQTDPGLQQASKSSTQFTTSTALIDFLASTPALTSPRPPKSAGAHTIATTAVSPAQYNRHHYHQVLHEPQHSPEKPASSGKQGGGGWKKVFGNVSGGHKKNKSVKILEGGGEMKNNNKSAGNGGDAEGGRGTSRDKNNSNNDSNNHNSNNNNKKKRPKSDELHHQSQATAGFMGVGKDGVWISRKNFVKT